METSKEALMKVGFDPETLTNRTLGTLTNRPLGAFNNDPFPKTMGKIGHLSSRLLN